LLAAFVVCCAIGAIAASTASADYTFSGTFSGPGSGDGELTDPGRAAVDPVTGRLYVVDSGNDRVQVFKPKADGTAEYLTQFGGGQLSEPWGIAFDEQGDRPYIYVADAGNDRIVKYASDRTQLPSFAVVPFSSFTSPGKGGGAGQVGDFHAALAIDPTTHDLLVADEANKVIDRFGDDGGFISSFDGTDGGSALEGPIDVAVNSTGDVYVVDASGNVLEAQGTSSVLRYSASGEYKATLGPVGFHERPNAITVNPVGGEVIVAGDPDNVYEAGPLPWQPVLAAFDSSDQPLPAPEHGPGTEFAAVSGLAVSGSKIEDHLYVVLGQGHWFGSPYGSPGVQAFGQPHPAAPVVGGPRAVAGRYEATLSASIDPGLLDTRYRFEYGPTSSYGRTTAGKVIPSTGPAGVVTATVTGLAPSTTYHFRAVAENALGTAESSDVSFDTGPAEDAPDTCPNAAIRALQQASFLAECRAYELVSPADKNGGEIQGTNEGFGSVQVAPDGSGAAFPSLEGFAGTESVPVATFYRGRRVGDGWATVGLQPPQQPSKNAAVARAALAASSDLSKVLVASEDALAPGAVQGQGNLYLRDDSGYEFIATSPKATFAREALSNFSSFNVFAGGTADFSTLLIRSQVALNAEATEGVMNLYEWKGGRLRVIKAPAGPWTEIASDDVSARAVSDDGSRIFFTGGTASADGASGLYLEESGVVKPLSVSRRAGEMGAIRDAKFVGASRDGSIVWFLSSYPLTEAANPPLIPGEPLRGSDLYRYDLDTDELTDETVVSPAPNVSALANSQFGVSVDGETVYFTASADLASGAAGPTEGISNLYRRSHGQTKLVVTLEPVHLSNGELGYDNPSGMVSPDGRYLSFTALSKLGYENSGFKQIYLYDSDTGILECVSCDPTGAPARGPGSLSSSLNSFQFDTATPRSVDNAGTVFFDTPNRLVSGDVNGVSDAYRFSHGEPALISTGRDPSPSYFAAASADGSSVFFKTRQPLVGRDTDEMMDLYVAREGGGFAEPSEPPPPCQGEACQEAAGHAPTTVVPGSSTFLGPPNKQPAKAKPKKHKKPSKKAKPKRSKSKHKKKGKKAKHGKKQQQKKGKGSNNGHGKQRRAH